MSKELPTVSIIIPAYNEQDKIVQCLEAARYQTVLAEEILVVDNKSTDGTRALVRNFAKLHPKLNIRLLAQNEVQGLIPTRNFGFEAATGSVLGRIDADSVLEPNWVADVKATFSDTSVAAVTGPVLYYDMPMRRFGLKADNAFRKMFLKLSKKYKFLFGSNMAISKLAWQQIRTEVCLDEPDELHEDIDLSVHLADNRLKVKYSQTMICGMSARRLESSPRDYHYYVMRFERTYKKHQVKNPALRFPAWLFLLIYPPLHLMRKFTKGKSKNVFDAKSK